MHLVFLNQYYPPDAAPTGVMLEAVVEECVRQGHQVTVICAAGGYADGVKLKSEIGKTESKDENPESGIQTERGIHFATSSVSQPSTPNSSSRQSLKAMPDQFSSDPLIPRPIDISALGGRVGGPGGAALPGGAILRLPATRFGRGTFVGKLADYASYYLGVAWTLGTMSPPPDRIVALTTPPYLSILARAVSKLRGATHAHWVMDLYPDVMVAHGMLAEGGWKHRLLACLARWGFGGRRCVSVLALGPDMALRCERVVGGKEELSVVSDRLSERSLLGAEARPTTDNRPPTTVSWVPLWGGGESRNEVARPLVASGAEGEGDVGGEDSEASHPCPTPTGENGTRPAVAPYPSLRAMRGWAPDELVVMYSGNMGLGHRFGEILEVVRREEEELSVVSGPLSEGTLPGAEARPTTDSRQSTTLPTTRFVFYGGGKRRGEIEAFIGAHPEAPVELHEYASAEELSAHLTSADVHLVSLEPEWTGTMVPSKLQGIFAVGRPVVFVGSRDSSIGRWVEESGGGWVVAPGDVNGLRAALEEARDPQIRKVRGDAARAFARKHFDKATNAARVAEIFTR